MKRDEESWRETKRLYELGLSQKQVSDMTYVSKSTTQYRLRIMGVKIRPRGRARSRTGNINGERRIGKRAQQKREWDRVNISSVGAFAARGIHNPVRPVEIERMQDLRDQGYTIADIAASLGRSYYTVRQHTHPRHAA